MKNSQKIVRFNEPEIGHRSSGTLKAQRNSSVQQGSYYKKIQNNIVEKLKNGYTEEAFELLMSFDKDFVIKVLSTEHFKPIKWAMLSDEIKIFETMIGLLDYESSSKMLNDHGRCSSFTSFLTKYSLKKHYDSDDFISGAKVFLKIDIDGCAEVFARSVLKNEQIVKDFETAITQFNNDCLPTNDYNNAVLALHDAEEDAFKLEHYSSLNNANFESSLGGEHID